MSRQLTLLFGIAAGAAVGNLYLAQPLLAYIGEALGVSTGAAGLLVTVTQVGYAAGVFLIVPLGDTLNRRRLIPAAMGCSALALAASALAPTYSILLVTLTAVGITTVSGQLLIPLAGDLATDEQRGSVVGAVVSGLLAGILVSRTASGILADALGWRAVYAVAATVTLLMALLIGRQLPALPPRARIPYGRLLGSVFATVRAHSVVRATLALGACAFATFTLFWTGLTFLLSEPPFSYSVTRIGLVGFAGLVGALGARRAGRLHDLGWSVQATGAALLLAMGSLGIAGFGSGSIFMVLFAVVLIDLAIQAVNVLNQTRLFAVDPGSRSRLNTAFVTSNFIGGAIGSALAAVLWDRGGWAAVMFGGGVLISLALIVWLTQRRRAFRPVG